MQSGAEGAVVTCTASVLGRTCHLILDFLMHFHVLWDFKLRAEFLGPYIISILLYGAKFMVVGGAALFFWVCFLISLVR